MAKTNLKTFSETVPLLEGATGQGVRVDKAKGIVYGVKILGTESRYLNGRLNRRYSETALKDAAKMYKGMGVNTNHPDRKTPEAPRDVRDRFAWFEETEVRNDGTYGNMHCLMEHEFTPVFLEAAERNSSLFGLSHNATGPEEVISGVPTVTAIAQVLSVDCVQRPATNKGLFEEQEPEVKQNFKQFIESLEPSPAKNAFVSLIEEYADMGEMPGPGTPGGPDGSAPQAGPSADEQIKTAFRAAISAAFDDEKLDYKATLAKIKTILKAYDTVSEKPKEDPVSEENKNSNGDAATADADKAKMESMEAENAQLKAEKDVRSFMESQEVRPTETRVKALMPLDEAGRKSLCADFKAADAKAAAPAKPRSGSLIESQEREIPTADKIPTDAKDFAKFVMKKPA